MKRTLVMPADSDFAARLARIEQREKSGKKAEYAPLPVHPDEEKARRKSRRSGGLFKFVVFPLCLATVMAGVFANELSAYLPAEFVTVSNDISARIMAQIAPAGGQATGSAPAAASVIGGAGESEVSRILLGE